MKKIYFLNLVICLLFVVSVKAQSFDKNGVSYSILDGTTNEAEVTGIASGMTSLFVPNIVSYNNMDYKVTSIQSSLMNAINLVSVTLGENVKYIKDNAFFMATKLVDLNIPKSVTYIGVNAFSVCPKLKITLDKDNQNYKIVDDALLNKDETDILWYPATSTATQYTVPNTVKNIDSYTFYENSSLKTIVLPIG